MSKALNKPRRKDVPPEDHVARYCNPQRVIRDPNTNVIIGVFPQAFKLRPKIKEKYLSSHWMESFSPDVDTQFQEVAAALGKKLTIEPKAAIARLNVGYVIQAGEKKNHSIRIRDQSKPNDPGYSGIYGMPLDNSDAIFLDLLATECCIEVRSVSDMTGES